MDADHDKGQVGAALAALSEATERARAPGTASVVETLPLAGAYRDARPAGHALAGAQSPDLAFLGTLYGLGGAPLLGAARLLVAEGAPRMPPEVMPLAGGVEVRVPPSEEATGDVLALALGLTAEAAKLRRALGDGSAPGPDLAERVLHLPSGSMATAFGDVDSAAEALEALLSAPASRRVHAAAPLEPSAPSPADLVDDDGPVFVVAGASERLHDLISPWVRRLEPRLRALVGDGELDPLYSALPALLQVDPGCHDERVATERDDGLPPAGSGLVVQHRAVAPDLADPRARDALSTLKARRASTVLVGRSASALRETLARCGDRVRVVVVLAEALGAPGTLLMPDLLAHPAGALFEVTNALGLPPSAALHTTLHVPSLGLAPRQPPGLPAGSSLNALLWPLVRAWAVARAQGAVGRNARLAVGLASPASADASALALHCLAKMAAAPLEGPARRAA